MVGDRWSVVNPNCRGLARLAKGGTYMPSASHLELQRASTHWVSQSRQDLTPGRWAEGASTAAGT